MMMILFCTKMTNKMELCRIIYYSLAALRVSSDIFAHHQEHLNCIYSFWFYSRVSLSASVSCQQHVEQPRNNGITINVSHTAASCWSFYKNCIVMHGTINIKIKRIQVFVESVRYFCPILTKSVVYPQISTEVVSIKIRGNPSAGSRAGTLRIDGYDETNSHFSRLRRHT